MKQEAYNKDMGRLDIERIEKEWPTENFGTAEIGDMFCTNSEHTLLPNFASLYMKIDSVQIIHPDQMFDTQGNVQTIMMNAMDLLRQTLCAFEEDDVVFIYANPKLSLGEFYNKDKTWEH